MKSPKTTYIWVVLVLSVLAIIGYVNGILGLIYIASMFSFTAFAITSLVLSALGILLLVTFIYKVYFLRSDVITWVHVTFGYAILFSLSTTIRYVISIREIGSVQFTYPILSVLITIVPLSIVWFTFVRHLRAANVDGRIHIGK